MLVVSSGGTMSSHPALKEKLQHELKQLTILEVARFVTEVAGVLAVVAALIFSFQSVDRATKALEASNEQLDQARYQTVYERQLDLWKLGVEYPDVAPYILGGQ